MTQQSNSENWGRELSKGWVDARQLKNEGVLAGVSDAQIKKIKENFDVRIAKAFQAQLKNNSSCLAKQFVPSANELTFLPEELEDPIGDERWTPVEGITHRYPDRVLLKPTYLCAVYCRFCFRKNKVSQSQNNLTNLKLQSAIQYIETHSEIWEVILTGGDALVLTDMQLDSILGQLAKISHVKIIRFHTRILTALPSRIDQKLLQIFKNSGKSIWIAAHINSADEISEKTLFAVNQLCSHGISLVLQSVLLKGVNDTEDQLVRLLKTCVQIGIKPYYLHYPDLAKGTNHFRVPLNKAIALVKGLRGKISGLCIPHLIVDIPGGSGKICVNPNMANQIADNVWEFESPLDGHKITVTYPASI